jgi:hypothetical protein
MTGTPSAGTELSREILDNALGKQSREPASDPERPASFAEQIQDAIDQGASLEQIRRHFHLGESELRDHCADIMDDGADDSDRTSGSGY